MNMEELKLHLNELEKNPERVAATVSRLDEATLHYKPAPNKWSILEILAHLADVEIVWGYRLRQALAEQNATFAPIDQDKWAQHLGYLEASPAECLAAYKTNRRANLRLLHGIMPADLDKGGFHPELNRVFTVAEIIQRLAQHDPNHLSQIERLKHQARA